VLTRDRDLLKRRTITHGCYVHALRPAEQLRETFTRLDLAGSSRPFTLCLHCNAPLQSIDKAQVVPVLPPSVRENYEHFTFCNVCRRVFWKGSHWRRMRSMLEGLLTPS